jgi:hypothetical protein
MGSVGTDAAGLAIRVSDERDGSHERPTVEEFGTLLSSLGQRWNTWLVAHRLPEGQHPGFFQVLREASHAFRTEVRTGDGPAGAHVAAVLESAADVTRCLTAWAAGDEAWRAGRAWVPFEELDSAVEPDPDVAAEAAENARLLIECGYLDRYEVADAVIDMQEDFGGGDGPEPLVFPQAERIVDPLWRERLAEQATWPECTDVDALEVAFEGLEDLGIVAREDYACCARCGHSEIRGELDEDSRGYVFFHGQSTQGAVEGGLLYLYFGAAKPHRVEDVAQDVVDRLRAEGLAAQWNGEANSAILVEPIVWRKRIE